MRTVGEILQKARLEKKFSLEQAEKSLRIRKKYLSALEENDWKKLPSLPYIKGFIRNYSIYLGLKPAEMLAFFRRQFGKQEKTGLLPSSVTTPINDPFFRVTPQLTVWSLIALCAVGFFGYLFFQFQAINNPPDIRIDQPQEGEIVTAQTIPVSGQTNPDAVVTVNNLTIALSDNGTFTTTVTVNPGINTITIDSTSKYGKKRTVTRTIQQVNN